MSEPGLAGFELELRRIADVVGVGLERPDGALVVHLYLVPDGDASEVRRVASEVARRHVDEAVTIEIEGARRAERPERERGLKERVKLLAVRLADGEVEVHLTRTGSRTVGRSSAGRAEGAVAATIEALEALGVRMPYEARAVASVVYGLEHMVVVVLAPLAPGPHGTQRMGVASGATVEESATRATLHALNRFLETDDAFGRIDDDRASIK